MDADIQRVLLSAKSIAEICGRGPTGRSLRLLRDQKELFVLPSNLELSADLAGFHHEVRSRIACLIRETLGQLRTRYIATHASIVASMVSVEDMGGSRDEVVHSYVSRTLTLSWNARVEHVLALLCKVGVASPRQSLQACPAAFDETSTNLLELAFNRSHNLTAREVALVSELSGLSQAQVRVWFQNRRARARKIAEKEKRRQEEEAGGEVDSPEPALERRPVAALPKRNGKPRGTSKAATSVPSQKPNDSRATDKPRAVRGLPKRANKNATPKSDVTVPLQLPVRDAPKQRSLAPARSFSASSDCSATSVSSFESALHPPSTTAVSDMIPSVASSETAVSTNEAQATMCARWNGPMISLPVPNGETPSFNFVPPTPAKTDFTPWVLPEDFAAVYGTTFDPSSFTMPGFENPHVGQMMQGANWQETSLEDMFAMLNECTPQDISSLDSDVAVGNSPFFSNASSGFSPEAHSQIAASPATAASEDQAEDTLVQQLIAKWASETYHLDQPSAPESVSGPSSTGGSSPDSRPGSFMEDAFLQLDFTSLAGPSTDLGEISSEWSVEIPPPCAEGDALLREADEWLRFSPSPSPQPQALPSSSHSGSPASSMPHTPNSKHAGLADVHMAGLLIADGIGVMDPRYIPLPASPKMGAKDVVDEWIAGVLPFDLDEKSGWGLEPMTWNPLQ